MNSLTVILLLISSIAYSTASFASELEDMIDFLESGAVTLSHPIAVVLFTLISAICPAVKEAGLTLADITGLIGSQEPDLETLTLLYSTPTASFTYNISSAADDIYANPYFNASKKLFVYIHGFTSQANTTNYQQLSALLLSREHMVLALDASELLEWWYLKASTYTVFIGHKLAQVLNSMVDLGLSPSNVHIIGHSLGAHISGYTGKNFTNMTGSTIGRITGLDPAGPCFAYLKDQYKLSSTDAEFVDVIHSNAGVFGISDDVGHANYWPNAGTSQPGCTSETCSHGRSILYFIESISNTTDFPAVQCSSYIYYVLGWCSDNEVSYMGYNYNSSTSGAYHLTTASTSPYGLGATS